MAFMTLSAGGRGIRKRHDLFLDRRDRLQVVVDGAQVLPRHSGKARPRHHRVSSGGRGWRGLPRVNLARLEASDELVAGGLSHVVVGIRSEVPAHDAPPGPGEVKAAG